MNETLLTVRDVYKSFPHGAGLLKPARVIRALNGVSLHVDAGETLSVVGESGCGKSTVGRIIMGLMPATSGSVTFEGKRIDGLKPAALKPVRRNLQTIFQDPLNSLNPRMRIGDAIAEPLRNFFPELRAAAVKERVRLLIERVRLPLDTATRWPHEFSGGQRQRICIARALASNPKVIICDEAVSALDVSIKAQIVNLLQDLQAEFNLALFFISHDLSIVEHMSHRVAVMYMGRVVETGKRRDVFDTPKHPYTRALLAAVPRPVVGGGRNPQVLQGDIPSPMNLPVGCAFQTRCPQVFGRCRQEVPQLMPVSDNHSAACHLLQQ